MDKIKAWVKAHPKSTMVLVIGGGLVFILLSGWFSGGSSTTVVGASSSGPTDAEVAAGAQIQMAQIAAGASNAQSAAELEAAKLAAQLEMANIAAGKEVSLASLGVQQNLGIANLNASSAMFTIQNQTQKDIAALSATVANTQTNAAKDVQLAQISSNTQINTNLIEALKPQKTTVTDWEEIFNDRPDVAAAWSSTAIKNPKYHNDPTEWAKDWYYQWGQTEGYRLETKQV